MVSINKQGMNIVNHINSENMEVELLISTFDKGNKKHQLLKLPVILALSHFNFLLVREGF